MKEDIRLIQSLPLSDSRSSMEAARRTCLLVLGMHRSGTSAITRLLSFLGCDLPKTLMEAHISNEPGHWESDPIYRLNKRILESAGSGWNDWQEFNSGWFQSLKAEAFRNEAQDILQSEFSNSRMFVLKDPRICRMTTFWLHVLKKIEVSPLIVTPVRNPLEVAESLKIRNNFNTYFGHLLWLRHVLDAEFGTRGLTRYFTNYEQMIKGWSRIAADAQCRLGITWPRMSDRVAEEVDAFLSERYRHHRIDPKSVIENLTLSAWLRDTYKILENWAAVGENPDDYDTLNKIRSEFNSATPAFSRLISAGQKALETVHIIESDFASTREELGKKEQEISLLTRKLENHSRANEQIREENKGYQHTLSQTEKALEKARQEADNNARENERNILKLAQIEKELEHARQEAESNSRENEGYILKLTQIEKELEQARQDADNNANKLAVAKEELREMVIKNDENEKTTLQHKKCIETLASDIEARQSSYGLLEQKLFDLLKCKDEEISQTSQEIVKARSILKNTQEELSCKLNKQAGEISRLEQEIEEVRETAILKSREQTGEIVKLSTLLIEKDDKLHTIKNVLNRTVLKLLANLSWPIPGYRLRLRFKVDLLNRSGLFDPDWYLRRYKDVAKKGVNPQRHYIEHGANEGRAPNPWLED